MYQGGLVSVSFRRLSPEEVLRAAAAAGLKFIEWGSDVHAPRDDRERLTQLRAMQDRFGVACCSYGTYFRLGVTPLGELPGYIAAAKMLGTRILRLWCGERSAVEYTQEQREYLISQCRAAARMAEEEGVTLCLECHIRSYTETKEGALELMQAVDSPAFRMYWQPNQFRTVAQNLEYAHAISRFVTHIHVFQWKGKERFPLKTGLAEWRSYLDRFSQDHLLLLEFMPDDEIGSLPEEANALAQLTGGTP